MFSEKDAQTTQEANADDLPEPLTWFSRLMKTVAFRNTRSKKQISFTIAGDDWNLVEARWMELTGQDRVDLSKAALMRELCKAFADGMLIGPGSEIVDKGKSN